MCGPSDKNGDLPIPNLTNLDTYHEIGLDLDLENMDALNDDAYLALYRQKLEDWHSAYPIQADARLWPEAQPATPTLVAQKAVA